MTKEQVEQKKEQLVRLLKEAQVLKDELMAVGEWPLDEDDLDNVAGGFFIGGQQNDWI